MCRMSVSSTTCANADVQFYVPPFHDAPSRLIISLPSDADTRLEKSYRNKDLWPPMLCADLRNKSLVGLGEVREAWDRRIAVKLSLIGFGR